MTSTRQLEKNTRESFALARQDITALYDHVTRLHNVVVDLHKKNSELIMKVNGITFSKIDSFVASKTANKVHARKCAYAKNIKSKNKVKFNSKINAFNQGFKACVCVA